AKQTQRELTRKRPSQRRPPHLWRDALVVDRPLLIQRARAKQGADMTRKSRPYRQISLETARHQAGESVKIEAAALAGKPIEALVPIAACEFRQLLAQGMVIQGGERHMATLTKHLEKIVELERPH